MIHSITIENFGSIREAQTLDLRLPGTTPDLPRFRASPSRPEVRLPTVVAFFGPNASGKSTILSAFGSVISFVGDSFREQEGKPLGNFQPFRSGDWLNKPTRIIFEFDAVFIGEEPSLYRYELIVGHDVEQGDRVLRESLKVEKDARFHSLFQRDEGRIRVAAELDLRSTDGRLKAVRTDASVVSTLAALNVPLFVRVRHDVLSTPRNFLGRSPQSLSDQKILQFFVERPDALSHLKDDLRRIDIGINDINIKQFPGILLAEFSHDSLEYPIYMNEESNGTINFMRFFLLLFIALERGHMILIDEFDASLHPMLIPEIFSWFYDPERNEYGAQLLITAHNTALLDELEKEEVFLVEKDGTGATHILPVRDIAGLRREPSLSRKYLGGVLGAVPNIG